MKKAGTEALHLSVRQARDLERAKKDREDAEARIAALEQLGSKSINKLVKDAEKSISTSIASTLESMHIPATLVRRVVANAVRMAIPKSPRGRKPLEKKEEAA